MANVIEQIRQKQREALQACEASYQATVRAIALNDLNGGGAAFEPEQLTAVLGAAGKTVDDLDADVSRLRARLDARKTLDGREAVARDQRAAQAVLDEIDRERETVLAQLKAREREAKKVMEAIYERNRAVDHGRKLLLQTAPAEVVQRLDALQREQGMLRDRVHAQHQELKETNRIAKLNFPEVNHLAPLIVAAESWDAPSREAIEQAREKARRLATSIKQGEDRLAELEPLIKQALAEALTP